MFYSFFKNFLLLIVLLISHNSISEEIGNINSNKNEIPEIKIGAYITSLYDINQSRGTYSADIWIWAISDIKSKYKLEDFLEINYFSNEFMRTFSGYNKEKIDGKYIIEQKKVQGTFLHDFDMRDFPFDKQYLKFSFEDSTNDSSKVRYVADLKSGYDKSISIDGWIIKKIVAQEVNKNYDTNFGIYTKPSTVQYSQVEVTTELVRDSAAIFFKLTIGLLIAVLVALTSCLMPTHSGDIFSGRMGLLGGALIAAVVNQQFADSSQGNTTTVTLIDKLHMLGMFMMIVLLAVTARSRMLFEIYKNEEKSSKLDYTALAVCTILFFGSTLYFVLSAIYKATEI